MINLAQAKKQALEISDKENAKIYVIENGRDDYFTGAAPFSGWVGFYLKGEFITNPNLTKNEMAKTAKKAAAPKKAAKKVVKKVAAKKTTAKKVAAKTTTFKADGKVVDITVEDMRKNIAKGYKYRDPQGINQPEQYLATRKNQALLREGMLEFAPVKD